MAVKEKKKEEEPLQQQESKTARLVKKKAQRGGGRKAESLGEVLTRQERPQQGRPGLLLFTLVFIYKNLYILGISLLRQMLRTRRRLRRLVVLLKGRLFAWQHKAAQFSGRIARRILVRFRAPIQRIRETYRSQLPAIRAEREAGNTPIRPFLPVLEMVWRLVFKVLATVFNYAAPVGAAVFLLLFVQDLLSTPVALRLEYEGDVLGYITSEAVFEDAAQIVRERTLNQEDQLIAVSVPSFELAEPESGDYLDTETIADLIISHSDADIETAYGLFVGGRLVGAVRDKDTILEELAAIKAEGTTGRAGERVEWAKSIRLSEALYPSGSVMEAGALVSLIRRNETESDFYEVQEGDTPWEIAEKLGIPYNELYSLNPQIEDGLWPGDELQTRVARPYLPVQSVYTTTYEEEIPFEEEVVENGTFDIGYEHVDQEGVPGKRRVIVEVTELSGVETARNIIDNSEILVSPVSKRITKGIKEAVREAAPSTPGGGTGSGTPSTPSSPSTNMAPSTRTGNFIWPTVSGTATTYAGHGYAADIAPGGGGHPIYASASGTVSKVVNGYVNYGHYIVIDHGNGYETLYAHNSANYVKVGDQVNQGDVIAAMGRTGRATGNHLHFEVRYNGRTVSPYDYIGYSG